MNVFTYYHDVLDPLYPRELIDRWRDSWQRNGFYPHLLQECNATQNRDSWKYEGMTCRFPTVNSQGWERHCWIRWLAYLEASPGLFCDYDVINFSLKPNEVWHFSGLVALADEISPIVVADRNGIEGVLSMFEKAALSSILVDGKEHVSDMTMLMRQPIRIERKCVRVGDSEELTSPCVHFHNASLPPSLRLNNRWRAVDDLKERRCEPSSQVLM